MNNVVTLVGYISAPLTLHGNTYLTELTVLRESGAEDKIPVVVSEILNINDYIMLNGEFRSQNVEGKVFLYVYVTKITHIQYTDFFNDIFLEGNVTKRPTFRTTPTGKEISDIVLAVHREGKTDFIPCVLWGKNALSAYDLKIGDCIRVSGRIRSRKYVKTGCTMTAYEASINLFEVC